MAQEDQAIHDEHERVVRYAAEMGIGRDLIDAAAAVPFEKIRVLSRDDIARRFVDEVTVKGKTVPLKVYEVTEENWK